MTRDHQEVAWPGVSRVSIGDVAERARVSVGTVSNVLNRPEKVAETTRARVQEAIDHLGFVRNDAARQLKAGTSRWIGFVLHDVRNPFFADVARAAEQQAGKHGLSVLLANSDDQPEREIVHINLFEQQRVRGLLVAPIGDVFSQLERLRHRGLAAVLVDRVAEGEPFSSVSVDDVAGGHLAASHLIEQGCRRIAFVGGPLGIRQVADRLQGALQATSEHEDVLLEVLLAEGLTVQHGRKAGTAIAQRPRASRPDGVFCANDLLAVGALQAFTMLDRLNVPGDLALVGYDDISFASATVVPLTSIRQPSILMGETAVDLLIGQIATPASPPRQVVFSPTLVVRESSVR